MIAQLLVVVVVLCSCAMCEAASVQGVTFVVSQGSESQLNTCNRVGMYPTAVSASINWSFETFSNVTTDLGLHIAAKEGVSGCCVAGMWCNDTECFTQSFSSSFQNYGALPFHSEGFYPVFSCDGGDFCENELNATGGACNVTVPVSASNVSLSSVTVSSTTFMSSSMVGDLSGSTLLLQGSGFGTEESLAAVSLSGGGPDATPFCSYLEVCTNVCGTCGTSEDCELGAACLRVGNTALGHCFPYCAGSQDDSCPCGIPCMSVVVSTSLDSGHAVGVQQSFCSPDGSFSCSSSPFASGSNVAQCSVLGGGPVNTIDGQTVSIIVGDEGDVGGASGIIATNNAALATNFEPVTMNSNNVKLRGAAAEKDSSASADRRLSSQCSEDSDCNDGNRCTVNACVNSTCISLVSDTDTEPSCATSLPSLQQKSAPFTYLNSLITNATVRQTAFVAFMQENGQVAEESTTDKETIYMSVPSSNPDSSIPLDSSTQFQYFGNKITELGITPVGVVTLTPVPFCASAVKDILVRLIIRIHAFYRCTVFNLFIILPLSCSLYLYKQCVKYGSQSNTISAWNHDWAYEEDSQVLFYSQNADSDSIMIDNSSAPSVHMLYSNVYLDENKATDESNTFSVSMYADGSVRISYINIQYADLPSASTTLSHPEMFSLFGARAGSTSTQGVSSSFRYLKYHKEFVPSLLTSLFPTDDSSTDIPANATAGGLDVVYCYVPYTLGCVSNSCVSPTSGGNGSQMVMQLQSNGNSSLDMSSRNAASVKINSCDAMGDDIELAYSCIWMTGEVTAATLSAGTSADSSASVVTLSCDIPELPVSDGSVVSVTITAALSSINSASMMTDMGDGVHSMFTVTRGGVTGSETTSSEILLRYYNSSAGNGASDCGCNALQSAGDDAMYRCSACNVCSAQATLSAETDCLGSCFGSAYIDSCGDCSGGLSNLAPEMYCDFNQEEAENSASYNLVSFILFVFFCSMIIVCCCALKVFSHNAANSRTGNLRRQMNTMLEFELARNGLLDDDFFMSVTMGRTNQAQPAPAGLTNAEIRSLPSFKYEAPVGAGGANGGGGVGAQEGALTEDGIELGIIAPGVEKIDGDGGMSEKSTSPAPGDDSECCSICLESFKTGDSCRKLPDPCGHMFHESCIDLWLEMKTNCPLCKRSIRDILPGGPTGMQNEHRVGGSVGNSNSNSNSNRTGGAGMRQIHLSRINNGRGGRDGVFRITTMNPREHAFMEDHDHYQELPTVPVRRHNSRPLGNRIHSRRSGALDTGADTRSAGNGNGNVSSVAHRLQEYQDDMDFDRQMMLATALSMSMADGEMRDMNPPPSDGSGNSNSNSNDNGDESARSNHRLLYDSVPQPDGHEA